MPAVPSVVVTFITVGTLLGVLMLTTNVDAVPSNTGAGLEMQNAGKIITDVDEIDEQEPKVAITV